MTEVPPTNGQPVDSRFNILSLDGGGAKGFYTLGVLCELEALLGGPLHEHFDLVFGTSTGAIIAALIGLGKSVEEIHTLYEEYVPDIMGAVFPSSKSAALKMLAEKVFEGRTFGEMKTGVGLVATRYALEKPMIFKTSVAQAHGRHNTFVPGFGCTVADAVQASCSAYPFFKRKTVKTSTGDEVELIDGGFCANNPTLYAIADALAALERRREDLRVVSLGVGFYPEPKAGWLKRRVKNHLPVRLLQKTLDVNTQSMEQLRAILFRDVQSVRISDAFSQPEMATDLFERDLAKLNVLRQRGKESFATREADLKKMLL